MNTAFATTIMRLILLEAVGTRLPWLAAIVVIVTLGLAQFLGQVAIIEASQIQATLQAAVLRVSAVFIVVAFVVTHTAVWPRMIAVLLSALLHAMR